MNIAIDKLKSFFRSWTRSDAISGLALVCSVWVPIHLDNVRREEDVHSINFSIKLQDDGTLRIWQQSGAYLAPEKFTLQASYLHNGRLKDGIEVPIVLANYSIKDPQKAEYSIPKIISVACNREQDMEECMNGKYSVRIKYEVRGDQRIDYGFF